VPNRPTGGSLLRRGVPWIHGSIEVVEQGGFLRSGERGRPAGPIRDREDAPPFQIIFGDQPLAGPESIRIISYWRLALRRYRRTVGFVATSVSSLA
jgi:hypothetical protein